MLCPCLKCAHTSCMESFCLDILLVLDPRILGHARQPVCKLCLDLEHTQHVHKLYGWIHLLRVNFHSAVHPGAPLVVLSQSWVGGRPECVGVSSRTHGAQNRHYAEKRRRPWATEGWSSVMVWRTSRWTEKQDVNVINWTQDCFLGSVSSNGGGGQGGFFTRPVIVGSVLLLWLFGLTIALIVVSSKWDIWFCVFKLHPSFCLSFCLYQASVLRYADLSIVALSSRLDGVEQHHADKWDFFDTLQEHF